MLTRYSTKPDNDDVRQFAKKQLPVLRDGLKQLRGFQPPNSGHLEGLIADIAQARMRGNQAG